MGNYTRKTVKETYCVDFKAMTSLDEVVIEYTALKELKESYKDLGLKAPSWLANNLTEAKARAKALAEAKKRADLRKLKLEKNKLKTTEEKRKDVEAKIAALETELGSTDEEE